MPTTSLVAISSPARVETHPVACEPGRELGRAHGHDGASPRWGRIVGASRTASETASASSQSPVTRYSRRGLVAVCVWAGVELWRDAIAIL